MYVPVLDGGPDCRRMSSLDILLGPSGVVDLEDIEIVCEVMEAFRLLIDPAMEGLGMAVEFLFDVGAVLGRLKERRSLAYQRRRAFMRKLDSNFNSIFLEVFWLK